jgi:hypothetical protein
MRRSPIDTNQPRLKVNNRPRPAAVAVVDLPIERTALANEIAQREDIAENHEYCHAEHEIKRVVHIYLPLLPESADYMRALEENVRHPTKPSYRQRFPGDALSPGHCRPGMARKLLICLAWQSERVFPGVLASACRRDRLQAARICRPASL